MSTIRPGNEGKRSLYYAKAAFVFRALWGTGYHYSVQSAS